MYRIGFGTVNNGATSLHSLIKRAIGWQSHGIEMAALLSDFPGGCCRSWRFMKMRRFFAAWMVLAPAVLAMSACGGGDDDAKVRLVNATIDSALEVYLDNDDDDFIPSTEASETSGYQGESGGTYEVKFRKTGASTAALSQSLEWTKDEHYTLLAYERHGEVEAIQITEEEDTVSDYTKFNVLNQATDAGAVDVYVTGSDDSLSGQSAMASSISANGSSGFQTVNPGTYRIRITSAGSKTKVLLDIASVTFTKKKVLSLALLPTTGGVLVDGVLVQQESTVTFYRNSQARVRVVAALTGSATVTATADDTSIVSSLQSTSISDYTQITAGTPSLVISVNGTTVSTSTPTISAGNDYSVLVYGTAANPQIGVVSDDNRISESGSTYAKVRLAHLDSDETSALTLYANSSAKASSVAYGSVSTYDTQAATTSGSWQVSSPSKSSFCASTAGSYVTFTGGASYTLFALVGSTSAAPSCLLVQDH
jgi:Domain of unknown function (DUF4397)